jgi:hypothetical protein
MRADIGPQSVGQRRVPTNEHGRNAGAVRGRAPPQRGPLSAGLHG